MKNAQRYRSVLSIVQHFLIFFLIVAFVTTARTALFVSVLSERGAIALTEENISDAAKITFLNVLAITVIFTAVDLVRRKYTVEKPVREITEALDKIVGGDYSVRIPETSGLATNGAFNEIIGQLNNMADELSGVETLRSDFIANVSHEMKTPLAVIRNYATLLQAEELDSEKRTEYAKAVSDASRRLSDMMTNKLKLNLLENQKIYPVSKSFNLGEQLCESLLSYESVWETKNIEIETDIAEDVFVSADSELLSLVWSNLLSNAFKFTADGGRVSLSLSATEMYAEVKISDTGCGMTPEVGAHIFEKFYQADTSRATQGNGLGLALVKRVVDIVGADIGVESEPSIGTSFTVRIRRDSNGRI